MSLLDNKTVQRSLVHAGLYSGKIDGDIGDRSILGIRAFAKAHAPKFHPSWIDSRCRLAVEQVILKGAGFYKGAIDGLIGPMMQIAVERWQDYITFERNSPNPSAGIKAANKWPRHRDAEAFYGKPGTNHARFTPPYDVFYGGQQVKTITLNKKCVESGERILVAVLEHYGADEIVRLKLDQYGGSFNNRPMRNGTSISTHAYAAAWDWNPADNQLRMNHRTARFAHPDYAGWWAAHDAEGWISLGPARDMDYMHNQAIRF